MELFSDTSGIRVVELPCSSLNMVAFAKILKKYDKVVKWKLGPLYIREVERSYFATSDKVFGLNCMHSVICKL